MIQENRQCHSDINGWTLVVYEAEVQGIFPLAGWSSICSVKSILVRSDRNFACLRPYQKEGSAQVIWHKEGVETS